MYFIYVTVAHNKDVGSMHTREITCRLIYV